MFSKRGIEVKSPDQLRTMRRAGLVVSQMLAATAAEVRPGITTAELNSVAAEVLAANGATSNFLNYGEINGEGGFQGVVCLSVNDEIVHGVPGERVLAEGDLLSIDGGAIIDGWHGDSALTVPVGSWPAGGEALSDACRESLWAGIAAAKLGERIGSISAAIEASLTPTGYGIVEEYVGHGIGSSMHQPPDVPNRGRPNRGPKLTEGMVLCIEPMVTLGSPANTVLDDEWTVVTTDGSLACHWEHMITVTRNGVWVMTAEDGGEEMLNRLGVPFGPLSD
ncbi:type I methionyl aminopeptidase [Enemella sp. A6]|uniref:type I methionyl aminopeptidase n=1 Tax=Enemella sp. A6 TaxID=3440152 RepID=UPI003EB97EE5